MAVGAFGSCVPFVIPTCRIVAQNSTFHRSGEFSDVGIATVWSTVPRKSAGIRSGAHYQVTRNGRRHRDCWSRGRKREPLSGFFVAPSAVSATELSDLNIRPFPSPLALRLASSAVMTWRLHVAVNYDHHDFGREFCLTIGKTMHGGRF